MIRTASAGLNPDADNPLTSEWLKWAETIFVMERAHRRKLAAKFQPYLAAKRVICLDIPDDYDYMAPELIRLLQARVPRHLPSA